LGYVFYNSKYLHLITLRLNQYNTLIYPEKRLLRFKEISIKWKNFFNLNVIFYSKKKLFHKLNKSFQCVQPNSIILSAIETTFFCVLAKRNVLMLRSCICDTVKDYETKGHRVARQDRWSPVAKRGRERREHTWATLVESATSSVAQSQDVTRIFKWEGETIW